MNIEQAIDILKNSIADYVIGEYCEKCADNKICEDRNEDCYYQQAIDIVVTAYEKEKEEHKKECHNCDEYTARLGELETENKMLKSELEKEKEKNKKAIDFINDKNNYFEDGENWQNILKIKEILEE